MTNLHEELFREVRALFLVLRSGSTTPRARQLAEEHTAAVESLLEQIEPGCLEDGCEPTAPALMATLRPGAEERKALH